MRCIVEWRLSPVVPTTAAFRVRPFLRPRILRGQGFPAGDRMTEERHLSFPRRIWETTRQLRTGKFSSDVSWNLVSFGILGVSGVLLNIIIGSCYGAATLGVFNQVFALYIFLSQFAVFGVHYSIVKHVAQHSDDNAACDAIISSAIAVTALCAGAACAAGYLLSDRVGAIFSSPDVETGWKYVLPGLWCFALNKVLLGILNGKRFMRAFAFAQAARYILFIVFLVCFVLIGWPGSALPMIISAGEIPLLIFLLLYILRSHRPVWVGRWSGWGRRHINFGARGFLSGTMTDINSRVDVLMLGCFTTDKDVGIYSMASLIVQGLAQLAVVVKHNVNPILTQMVTQDRLNNLREVVRRGVRIFYAVMAVIGVSAVLLFPLAIKLLVRDSSFIASWAPFAILMGGLILCSGYLPFNMILVQAGYPGTHTVLMSAIVLTNVALNGLLIPSWGIHGAALATSASFVLSAVYLKGLVRLKIGVRI